MRRLLVALLVSLVLGVLALYLALPDQLSREGLSVLRRLDARWLAVIAVPAVLWWLLSALRLSFLSASTSRRVSLWQGVQAHLLGTFSAAVTPSGGGNSIGIAFLLTRFGLRANEAVAIAVMCVVGDLAFFSWSVPASYLLLKSQGVRMPLEQAGLIVTVLAVAALVVSYLLVFHLELVTRLLARLLNLPFLSRFRERSEQFLHDLELTSKRYSSRPWHWHLRFHALSGAARLPYFLVLNVILIALGAYANHLAVYTMQLMLHSVAFIIPTPGASGFQEGALSFALRGYVSSGALAAGIIVWRLYQHYAYLILGPLIGGPALLRARRPRAGGTAPTEITSGRGP